MQANLRIPVQSELWKVLLDFLLLDEHPLISGRVAN